MFPIKPVAFLNVVPSPTEQSLPSDPYLQKRVSSLERIVEEQRAYDNLVEDFRSWLVSQTQKVNQSLDAKGPPEIKLKTLQVDLSSRK